MADRFGGRYSPENSRQGGSRPTPPLPGAEPFRGQRRTRAGGRVNTLFIAPLIFLPAAFFRAPLGLATGLVGFGVLMLAAWLTREGVLAQEAYDARTTARRPAFPRKIAGSLLTGIGLAIGGAGPGASLLNPLIFGVLGAVLHFFAFGPDPLRDKRPDGLDTFETDRVARAVEEAERHLATMKAAIRRCADRPLEAHVDSFIATARKMFRQVEADPRDLAAARRYLGVYLMGASEATVKFADLYASGRDPRARADYEALISDLEANFGRQSQALLADDKTRLDIEIDVLRQRLQQEGIRPAGPRPDGTA